MIKQIQLLQFGKFKRSSFNMAPVTIFLGHNEAGKTTLCDALLDGICRPKGNSQHGKRLKNRYGEDKERQVKLVYEDEQDHPFVPDADEFVNLYAIQSGNTSLDFAAGKSWLEKIKAALFSGGLDPAHIRDALLQEASTKGSTRQMLLLKNKQEELSGLRQQLKQFQERRAGILHEETKVKEAGRELSSLEEQISKKEAQLQALTRELEQQKKIRERHEHQAVLEFLAKGKESNEKLAGLIPFKEDYTERFKDQEQQIRNLEEAVKKEEAQLEVAQNEKAKKEEKRGILEKQRQTDQRLAELAGEFLSSLRKEHTEPVIRKKTVWQPLLVALAVLAPALGLVFFFVLQAILWQVGLLLATCLAGLVLLFLARRTVETKDDSHVLVYLKRLKEDWNLRATASQLSAALRSETSEGLTRELIQFQHSSDTTFKLLKDLGDELDELTKEIRDKQARSQSLKKDCEQAKAQLGSWLMQKGIHTIAAYNEKNWQYKRTSEELERWTKELNIYLNRYKRENETALNAECTRLLAQLDKEITQQEKTQDQITKLEAELAQGKTEYERLKAQQVRMSQHVSEGKGVVKGSLGDLPETIIHTEQAISACEQALAEITLTREAAALAGGIFAELVKDTDILLGELSQELAGHFGELLPELRQVEVTQLNQAAIRVADAGGQLRLLENLSKGTVDAFYFAARLALAGKATSGKALLVFDEPFQALDKERTSRALRLLHKFYQTHGWQIVFFTKDEWLSDEIKTIFAPSNGQVTINRLTNVS